MAIEVSPIQKEQLNGLSRWPIIYRIPDQRYGHMICELGFGQNLTTPMLSVWSAHEGSIILNGPASLRVLHGVVGNEKGWIDNIFQYSVFYDPLRVQNSVACEKSYPFQVPLFYLRHFMGITVPEMPISTPTCELELGKRQGMRFRKMAMNIARANPVGSRENWLPNRPNSRG